MAEYLKALCVVDELLLQEKKIYIWGNDEAASGLFVKLCALFVKINGFVSDEWRGTTLWHRPVVALEDVDASNSVICIPEVEKLRGGGINGYVVCERPVILNPEFDKKQAVIYGAGRCGKQVLQFLRFWGIETSCFIDSDGAKVGSRIEDIGVKDVSYLEKLPDSAYVVEAGYFYKEIDRIVTKYLGTKKRFYREKPLDGSPSDIDVDLGKIIRIWTTSGIEQFSGSRRYYLYGVSYELVKKYQSVFELMEIQIDGVWDASDGLEKSVEDLLYEDGYLILIEGNAEKARKLAKKLGNLGLREGREYTHLHNPVFCGHDLSRNQMLDLNLGYTYLMDREYLGFQVLGNESETDYRIVVLGGSTTDGDSYEFKSWVDFLYEKCEGHHVTIFNGGISGYTSTQELIKLLRDIMKLKPNMVIVYDGENDAEKNYKHKAYSFDYLETVFSVAVGKSSDLELPTNVFNKDYKDSFDIWVDNIEFMYAIARSRGIKFFSFLQPVLCSKKESLLTLREKAIIRCISILNKGYASDARIYRKLAEERRIEETHDYIYDLSDIFDEENVYLDHCHVSEEGNRIIADKIWEKVKDYITHDGKPDVTMGKFVEVL